MIKSSCAAHGAREPRRRGRRRGNGMESRSTRSRGTPATDSRWRRRPKLFVGYGDHRGGRIPVSRSCGSYASTYGALCGVCFSRGQSIARQVNPLSPASLPVNRNAPRTVTWRLDDVSRSDRRICDTGMQIHVIHTPTSARPKLQANKPDPAIHSFRLLPRLHILIQPPDPAIPHFTQKPFIPPLKHSQRDRRLGRQGCRGPTLERMKVVE